MVMPVCAELPTVAVVLVNYGAMCTTHACIASVQRLHYPPKALTIWVVDNGSQPEEYVCTQATQGPFAVHGLRAVQNNGFSAGNNVAIAPLLAGQHGPPPAYIWLLNNDALVQPDTLANLVAFSQRQPTPALVGGVITYPDGHFQQVATRINLWTGSSKGYDLAAVAPSSATGAPAPWVDSLSGACMLVPQAVFQAVGLMPEAYFLYFEDVAFCLAARQAGYPCVVAPLAVITHVMGATTNAIPQQRSYYYYRNRWRVCWQFGHGAQRATLVAYGVFRWVRSMVKAQFYPASRSDHHVLWLALCDAITGVTGPCPHPQLQ
jgi:N-acetylglucosaminyl-diphospho-decaprenol L-rhamnosyltransferase